jgi:hypothetical protein
MSVSDLERLMRAVKVIAKLASKYRDEDVAEALMKHCTVRERVASAFVGTFLTDAWESNRKAEEAVEAAEPRCCGCGQSVHEWTKNSSGYARSDARYCSAKCRQKAYRKRVTAKHGGGGRRRNVRDVRHGSRVAIGELDVTPPRAYPGPASPPDERAQ